MARAAKGKPKRKSPPARKWAAGKKAGRAVEVPVKTARRNRPQYGSDAVAQLLQRYGFDYAFLNPGSSFRGLQDSLVNYNANKTPKVILGLHEDTVAGMAQGYATASGRPALCILHDMVGLMHGSMGVFNIYCAGMPVLVLGGSGPSESCWRSPGLSTTLRRC